MRVTRRAALIFAGRLAEAEAFADAHVMAKPGRRMSYQTLGDRGLTFPRIGEPERHRRQLGLDTAVANTRFVSGGVGHLRKVVAAAGDRVIAVRIGASGGPLDMGVALTSPQKNAATHASGNALPITGANTPEQTLPAGVRSAGRALVQPGGGTLAARDDRLDQTAAAVDLLPAVPRTWRSGSVTGLRVRGGCGADLRWGGGWLASVPFRPDIAGTRLVRWNGRAARATLRGGRDVRLTQRDFTEIPA